MIQRGLVMDIVGSTKVKDGLFMGDEFSAQVLRTQP